MAAKLSIAEFKCFCLVYLTYSVSRPTFSVLGGVAKYDYGCGACPADTPACMDCDSNSTVACNTPDLLGEDFQCYDYSYNADKKVFAIKKDPITCHRLNETKIHCNRLGSVRNSERYINIFEKLREQFITYANSMNELFQAHTDYFCRPTQPETSKFNMTNNTNPQLTHKFQPRSKRNFYLHQ